MTPEKTWRLRPFLLLPKLPTKLLLSRLLLLLLLFLFLHFLHFLCLLLGLLGPL